MTRLQARLSSLERSSDPRSSPLAPYTPLPKPLPVPDAVAPAPPSPRTRSPRRRPAPGHAPPREPWPSALDPRSSPPPAAVHTGAGPPPRPLALDRSSLSLPPSERSTLAWLRSTSADSSLDLPPELRAALRDALSRRPRESSARHSTSPHPDPDPHPVDQSWQGLSSLEPDTTGTTTTPTSASDLSFNPLTYMLDQAGGEDEEEEEEDGGRGGGAKPSGEWDEGPAGRSGGPLGSLSGMLRFVNQTLAMQEDTSLWDAGQAS